MNAHSSPQALTPQAPELAYLRNEQAGPVYI